MALEAPPASSPAVHNVMIANTSKDTKPELRVRRMLREAGYPGSVSYTHLTLPTILLV